jgi:ATP-dependent DNA helicase DinG
MPSRRPGGGRGDVDGRAWQAAPGATCNLVVVDRVPNPVDDARVPALVARLGCDRWVADGLVYVADAALLLKQATGRLVRRESDSGLLAVLDPRLRRGPWGYRGKAASAYADALKSFPPAVSPLEAAVEILSTERARDDRACARQAAPAAAVAT